MYKAERIVQVVARDEFVKNCVLSGYCTKIQAEVYADGRDVLTEDDYIEVFRKAEAGKRW